MKKKEVRNLHKKFRSQGVPFILSIKTARVVWRNPSVSEFVEKMKEFSPQIQRSCDCCGLPYINLELKGKNYVLDLWRKTF